MAGEEFRVARTLPRRPACAAWLAAVTAGVVLAACATADARPVGGAKKRVFAGHLCSIVTAAELTAAHISAPCNGDKRRTRTIATPLGSVTTETFSATWGHPAAIPHELSVAVGRVRGSAAAIAYGRTRLRREIIGKGVPVGLGSVSSLESSTSSCVNPPTEDCTNADLDAIVGNYSLDVILFDAPVGGQREVGSDDEPEDIAQEEAERGPMLAIARTVSRSL